MSEASRLEGKGEALFQNARNALQLGDFNTARQLLEDVLEIHPLHIPALQAAIEASVRLGDSKRPLTYTKRALGIEPANPQISVMHIDALLRDQNIEEATRLAQAASERHPDFPYFRLQVGRGREALGDIEKARASYWSLQELLPDSVEPLYFLSRLSGTKDLDRLEQALEPWWPKFADLEQTDQLMLAFSSGAVAEKQGQIDKAWAYYKRGNELKESMTVFDEAGFVGNLNAQLQAFAHVSPETDEDSAGKGLVFIVSLPRSGSTLTEQILGSHSRTRTIGERPFVREAFEAWHKAAPPNKLSEGRAFYLAHARKVAGLGQGEDAVIVDKAIVNFILLGFLRTLFPKARFVHVVRAPLDAAFSCYATPFGTGAIPWANNINVIGRIFGHYQRLMKTWMRLWPDHILTLAYEDLIADPETKTRQLLAFCDLEWEPACLEFHKAKGQIVTASASQVRQPIYQSAKGRAAPFDAYLEPLKKTLGAAADPEWHKKI